MQQNKLPTKEEFLKQIKSEEKKHSIKLEEKKKDY